MTSIGPRHAFIASLVCKEMTENTIAIIPVAAPAALVEIIADIDLAIFAIELKLNAQTPTTVTLV